MNREWAVFSVVATVAVLAIGLVVVGASQGLFGFASASSGATGVQLERVVSEPTGFAVEPTATVPLQQTPARTSPAVAQTPSDQPSVTQAPPAQALPDLTTYQVGDAGLVTLEIRNGRLTVVSVQPAAGWTVTEIEEEDGEVEVEFVGPSGEIEFAAALQGGEIVTFIESEANAYAGSTSPSYDDDDEHEGDEEREEHENDDDEDKDDD